ncbi:pirin family protein [Motilibacter sp. K478]|nr:pirin family protein [Motilibacter aurantiacus]
MRSSFSFEHHYDPANISFGLLLAVNEVSLAPGTGFDTHAHRDVEVVTWVLSGTLLHSDSAGHSGAVRPGQVQRMGAGRGVEHTERAPAAEPVRFLQMWLRPAEHGTEPEYSQRDVGDALGGGGWVTVASGTGQGVPLAQPAAALHVARLPAGGRVPLPAAPYLHLFVARGDVQVEGVGKLSAGDAARLREVEDGTLCATGAAEVLAWEMSAMPR